MIKARGRELLLGVCGFVLCVGLLSWQAWAEATGPGVETTAVVTPFEKVQIRFRRTGSGGSPSRITLLGQSKVEDSQRVLTSMAASGVSLQTGLSSSPAEGTPCSTLLAAAFPAATCRVLVNGAAVECRQGGSLVRARANSADPTALRIDARIRVGDFASEDRFGCSWNPGTAGVEATAQVASAATLRTATASKCSFASAGTGRPESVRCRWRAGEDAAPRTLTSVLLRLDHPAPAVVREVTTHPEAAIEQIVGNDVGGSALVVALAPPEKIGGTIVSGPVACVDLDTTGVDPATESLGCTVVDADREGVPVPGVACSFVKGCDETSPEKWRVSVELPR